ncbi:unnamed protein product, partial [Durusdinium trenchii]
CRDPKTSGGFGPNVGHDADLVNPRAQNAGGVGSPERGVGPRSGRVVGSGDGECEVGGDRVVPNKWVLEIFTMGSLVIQECAHFGVVAFIAGLQQADGSFASDAWGEVKNLTQHPSMSFGEVVALPASCSTPGVEPDCLEQLRQDCLAASEKCFCGDYGYLFHEGFASFLETNASEEEGASFFYCCSLESCKHLAHNYDSAGLALLIVGVIGVLISTLYLQLPRRIVTLKPNDEEYLAPAWRGDGAALHDQVPFHEWCVNLEDLRQFRRLVMHAVAQGQLRPTERDPFEVMDWTGGSFLMEVRNFRPPVLLAGGYLYAMLAAFGIAAIALSPPYLSEHLKRLSVAVSCTLMSTLGARLDLITEMGELGWMVSKLSWFQLCCCLEIDRVMTSDAYLRSQFLQRGFSGRLVEAECSAVADKENIHHELALSGKAQEVEDAVQTLMHMNLVTPELESIVSLAGTLGDVSYFRWFLVSFGVMVWAIFPLVNYGLGPGNKFSAFHGTLLVEAILWLALLAWLPPERQTFATSWMKVWLLHLLVFDIYDYGSDNQSLVAAAVVGPLCILVSLAGPLRVARIPCLGILLIKLFAYCALSSLTILDALDQIDVDACVDWILRCMNYEGSFGPVPRAESHAAYVFCAVQALALVDALEAVDVDRLGWWLCERQTPSGGFNGRPEKARPFSKRWKEEAPDVCYSWWILSALVTLDRAHWIDMEKLADFIALAQDQEEILGSRGAEVRRECFGLDESSIFHIISRARSHRSASTIFRRG